MTARLNGWHRLWIVACVPLLVFGALMVQANWSHPAEELMVMFVQFGLFPCALLYALGWSVGWVIRGFKGHGR